jgi:hypothetical protein
VNAADFPLVRELVRESRLWHGASLAWSRAAQAAATSRAAHHLRRWRTRSASRPAPEQVRLVAVVVAVAALTHAALLLIGPVYPAPALPRALWLLVALLAGVTASLAGPVAAAWTDSGICRLLRRLAEGARPTRHHG